jgi:hypothetical protein
MGVVFGLTWLFVIVYGSYNIGASIVRHEWPKPLVIIGAVLCVALLASWGLIERAARNAQENKKPAARAKGPPAQEAPPPVTYRGDSVYFQDRPKTPS